MSAIVPFGQHLPAYMQNRKALASINKDVAVGQQFPTLSIKGKVFAISQNNEKRMLTRPDDPDEVLQNINLAVLRANTKSRVYYAKSYTEGESDGARPTCFSNDGESPDPGSIAVQAKKCAVCAHAVWGSKLNDDGTAGKGTECSVNTRLAVADPDKLEVAMLLRVPAGSRKNFADAAKAADARGIPYNAMVLKVGFDKEAPSPKLTFKPVGLLDDAAYAKAQALYESEIVKEIVGLGSRREQEPAPEGGVDAAELDAAIAAKAATTKAQVASKPAAKPAAKPTPPPVADSELDALVDAVAPPAKAAAPAPAPTPAPKAAKAPVEAPAGLDNLLGELDALLGSKDD